VPPYTLQGTTQTQHASGHKDNDIAKKMMEKKERLAEARASFVKSIDKLNEELVFLKGA
jgi:hypothetical protein